MSDTHDNPFGKPAADYQRNFDIVSTYYDAGARYLQLQTGRPYDECLAFVRDRASPEHAQGMKNPKALVLEQQSNGDREAKTMSFMGFLQRVRQEDLLLSPSMTAYHQPTKVVSTHAAYIKEGTDKRSGVKAEQFAAVQNGEHEKALFKDGEQNNLKTLNNTYSGATVSLATILHLKSTHSSLTSTCRTATSYANSLNEKFLAGNRHYYTPEITKANILSLVQLTDLVELERVVEHYGLVYPTPEQAWECIERSMLYWESPLQTSKIQAMLAAMTPIERAAVVYVSDLYHLHKFNPEFVITFLFSVSDVRPADNVVPDAAFEALDDDTQMLAFFLCYDSVKGRGKEKLLKEEPAIWELVKKTAVGITDAFRPYADLIRALFLTENMPLSIHAFPNTYRRAAVVSDTDSTMFTMQYWVEQAFGRHAFTVEAKRMVFSLVYMVSGMLSHVLGIQSANMGVKEDKLRLLAMKNEFYFGVLVMTSRSKHYYASQDAREGVMFAEPELEVKGVGLRDSKVPPKVNAAAKEFMWETINTVKNEEYFNLQSKLHDIANQERDVVETLENGSFEYLTTGQIKAKKSYKAEEDAPAYQQYLLWNEVFAPDFGPSGDPPYQVVKVSLRAGNKTEIEDWCRDMGNEALASRLREYMVRKRKSNLNTLQIPYTVVETNGIPPEIIKGIDKRKVVFNTMGVNYLMLESLGVALQDKRLARLVSDYH